MKKFTLEVFSDYLAKRRLSFGKVAAFVKPYGITLERLPMGFRFLDREGKTLHHHRTF